MTVRSFHRGLLVVTAVAVMAAACNRADAPAPIDKDALAAVDDERLATYVQARYQTDSSIRASDITVSAADGVVTLRGTVPDESAREHAVSLARQVKSVRKVDDQLQIVAPGAGDAATTSRPVDQPDAACVCRVRSTRLDYHEDSGAGLRQRRREALEYRRHHWQRWRRDASRRSGRGDRS